MERDHWCLLAMVLTCPMAACDRAPSEPVEESAATTAPSAPATTPTSQPRTEDEATTIVTSIQTSQREGVAGRNPNAFMRIWDKDAKLISGRTERPDSYDHALGYAQFRQSAHARSRGKADAKLELEYRDEKVTIAGDRATVTWHITVKWRTTRGGIAGEALTAERWELRKTAAGWRVIENRFWPLATTAAGKTILYDNGHWRQVDEAVTRAETSGAAFVTDRSAAPLA